MDDYDSDSSSTPSPSFREFEASTRAAILIQRSFRRASSRRAAVLWGPVPQFEEEIIFLDDYVEYHHHTPQSATDPGDGPLAGTRSVTFSLPPDHSPDLVEASEDSSDNYDEDDDESTGKHVEVPSKKPGSSAEGDDEKEAAEEDRKAKRSFMWGVAGTATVFLGGAIVNAALGGGPVDEDDLAATAALSAHSGGAGSVTSGSAAGAGASAKYVLQQIFT